MLLTLEQLEKMMPYSTDKLRLKFLTPLNKAMEEFKINTPLRIAAFIAQITHESGSLRYVSEIAGGKSYEYRKDLGNTILEARQAAYRHGVNPGTFYKGHGLIQITGYYNHIACGKALGLDLVNEPMLLCTPENAARSAAWFWLKHDCNFLADSGLFDKITKVINGGYLGKKERDANYILCKDVLECS